MSNYPSTGFTEVHYATKTFRIRASANRNSNGYTYGFTVEGDGDGDPAELQAEVLDRLDSLQAEMEKRYLAAKDMEASETIKGLEAMKKEQKP